MRAGHGPSRLDLHMELGRQLQLGEVRFVFPGGICFEVELDSSVFSSLFADRAVFGRKQRCCLFWCLSMNYKRIKKLNGLFVFLSLLLHRV